MAAQGYILFIFGISLVISLALIIIFYYTKKRKDDIDKIEEPKYRMMQDDD